MQRLPPELARAVCHLVDNKDIQSLRVVSKYYNAIASPFLLSGVQLVFHPLSFERLLAISQHPVISKQVKSLWYEPELLKKYETPEAWERTILDSEWLHSIPHPPPSEASEEERDAYSEALDKFKKKPKHSYSRKQLEAAYCKYQELYQGQQDLIKTRYGNAELVDAMARLPNLQAIVFSLCSSLEPESAYSRRFFHAGLQPPGSGTGHGHAAGVPQLRSIYHSAFLSGTRFKSFTCGDVSWQLFKAPKKDLAEFAGVISDSHSFYLHLTTGYDQQGDRGGTELRQCRRYLRNGRVCDLVSQATKIEILKIHLDWTEPVFGIDFKDVVGSMTWPRLTDISFGKMESSERVLVAFFARHGSTLRSFHIDTFHLTVGQWTTALPQIRASLEHPADVLIEGYLTSEDRLEHYDLGMESVDDPTIPSENVIIRRRKALEAWFMNGGDCPLVEEWSSF